MTIKELYSSYYERLSKHYPACDIYLSLWNSEGMYCEAGNCQIGKEKCNCASVSKLFTFLAFGIAEKRQLISVDTTVGEIIPKLKLYYFGENMTNSVTIGMLLRHSSGLPQFATVGNVFIPENDLKQHIFSLDKSELLFEPGYDSCYSNLNYDLLSYILELVFECSYERILSDYVFSVFLEKEKLNNIKSRQWWHPVNAIVLSEYANEWFGDFYNSPFILHNFEGKEEIKKLIPAIFHVNGTYSMQTIDSTNSMLYQILKKFYEVTKVPILCNSSLNDKEEPIIETIDEIINFALRKKISVVYINEKRVQLDLNKKYNLTKPLIRKIKPFLFNERERRKLLKTENPYNLSHSTICMYFTTRLYKTWDIKKEYDANYMIQYSENCVKKEGKNDVLDINLYEDQIFGNPYNNRKNLESMNSVEVEPSFIYEIVKRHLGIECEITEAYFDGGGAHNNCYKIETRNPIKVLYLKLEKDNIYPRTRCGQIKREVIANEIAKSLGIQCPQIIGFGYQQPVNYLLMDFIPYKLVGDLLKESKKDIARYEIYYDNIRRKWLNYHPDYFGDLYADSLIGHHNSWREMLKRLSEIMIEDATTIDNAFIQSDLQQIKNTHNDLLKAIQSNLRPTFVNLDMQWFNLFDMENNLITFDFGFSLFAAPYVFYYGVHGFSDQIDYLTKTFMVSRKELEAFDVLFRLERVLFCLFLGLYKEENEKREIIDEYLSCCNDYLKN